jgi:transposase
MAALSMDLRERILKAYDRGDSTREQVAERYCVSVGMVKKLLARRKAGAGIGHHYDRCGRKAVIEEAHREVLGLILIEKPDLTLKQLREAVGLACTLPAIHYVLADMGMTYKKRLSTPASKADPMSSKGEVSGSAARIRSIPHDSSSSTSRRLKRT